MPAVTLHRRQPRWALAILKLRKRRRGVARRHQGFRERLAQRSRDGAPPGSSGCTRGLSGGESSGVNGGGGETGCYLHLLL